MDVLDHGGNPVETPPEQEQEAPEPEREQQEEGEQVPGEPQPEPPVELPEGTPPTGDPTGTLQVETNGDVTENPREIAKSLATPPPPAENPDDDPEHDPKLDDDPHEVDYEPVNAEHKPEGFVPQWLAEQKRAAAPFTNEEPEVISRMKPDFVQPVEETAPRGEDEERPNFGESE